jgi:predicted amidophosphoribosyltransferase
LEAAKALCLHDGGSVLEQAFGVEGDRGMTIENRRSTWKGRSVVTVDVREQTLLLIDDVAACGVQAQQAITARQAAGASEVRFVAVAKAVAAP